MYDFLRGKLVSKQPMQCVLDVNGVGYVLKTSLSTSEQLAAEGEEVVLKTYLHVREDVLQLYGFLNDDERELFLGLISISGVGPKLAQTILSGLSPQKLVSAIGAGDEKALSSVSGVGKKTAQRLVVELQDKLSRFSVQPQQGESEAKRFAFSDLESEAAMALMSLGYKRSQTERAILRVRKKETLFTVEELIKKALQSI